MLNQSMIKGFWFVQKKFFPQIYPKFQNSKLHGNFETVSKLPKISKNGRQKTLESGVYIFDYHDFLIIIKSTFFHSHVVYSTQRKHRVPLALCKL
jgi:hypothetical protein